MSLVDERSGTIEALLGIDDPERLGAVEATGLLAQEQDPTLDGMARLAAALAHAPSAFVTLVGGDRQVTPGAALPGAQIAPNRRLPLTDSFCQFSVVTGERLVISDVRRDPLVRETRPASEGGIVSYAGFPLRTDSGHVLGSLCVVDVEPREWTTDELALLAGLAVLVRNEIEGRLDAGRLLDVQSLAERLGAEVDALGDVLGSLLDLADRQDEPRLQRYAAVTRSRNARVTTLARELRESSLPAGPHPARTPAPVDLNRTALRAVRSAAGTSGLELRTAPVPLLIRCEPMALERALVHLVVTVLHHSAEEAVAEVSLAAVPNALIDGQARARLTVRAPGAHVPTGELGRLVSRFGETASGPADGAGTGPATLRMEGGAVRARSGQVDATSSREGLVLTAEWDLVPGAPPALIDLR